jgi:hypothetical protein
LRWTTELGGPRLRAGVLGNLTLPLWIDERPGALVKPADNRDVGVMGLVWANLGWFSVPLRLHLNAGYWWSRNDGAFIYSGLPTSMPVTGVAANRNDVVEYGMALEAGLRRAVVFVELRSEQFVDARSAVASRENLWQVTPGFRTQLTSSVGLTGGVSFDLSSNDEGTAFDPATAYPDFELKLGLTLGSVLSRERREEAHRDAGRRAAQAKASAAAEAKTAAAAVVEERPAAEVAEIEIMAPVPVAAPVMSDALRIKELEERLARVETAQRIASLEARLAAVEGLRVIEPVPAPATAVPVEAPVVAPVAPAARFSPVPAQVVPTAKTVAPTAAVKTSAEIKTSAADVVPPTVKAAPPVAAVTAPEVGAAEAEVEGPTPAVAAVAPVVEDAEVKDEVQAQLDLMQQEIQLLRAEQAARLAATPPPSEAAAASDRATVITNTGRSQRPSVVTIPVPASRPAAQTAAATPPAAPAEGEAGDSVELLPEVLAPYQAPAPTAQVVAPVEDVAPGDIPVAEVAVVQALGMNVGTRRVLSGVDAAAAAPLASPTARAELESLAAELAAWPSVGVVVLVHGGGTDRSAALARTDSMAVLIKEYLVSAGAPLDNVMALGMGLSERSTPTVEVERIR